MTPKRSFGGGVLRQLWEKNNAAPYSFFSSYELLNLPKNPTHFPAHCCVATPNDYTKRNISAGEGYLTYETK